MSRDDYLELPPKERERTERREKKRRPKMAIAGRSLLTLAQIIQKKAQGEEPLAGRSRRRKKRRKRVKR